METCIVEEVNHLIIPYSEYNLHTIDPHGLHPICFSQYKKKSSTHQKDKKTFSV